MFDNIFGTPYPFSKYDTIFCHEFAAGAMENPGLITFNDTYLYPEAVSLEKMLAFASTIIHENSHNWFGNLVTMKWWDDLWLNESFADFIAHYGLEMLKDKVTTIPTYDSGWKIFLVRGVAGYREDQITDTTHAVRSEVQNTSVASTYFDRITYQKGSATLKQLKFLMDGDTGDNFFSGVRDYFSEFGWKNATIDDFLGKMQAYFENTSFTLDDWKDSWLLTPSLNTGYVEWDPSDASPKATLTIHQDFYSSVYPFLRYHKTRVALFYPDTTYDVIDVMLAPSSSTTVEYDGSKGYQAVLVNVDYWDYFKYTID
jgi:aminopeptidase N